MHDVVRSVLVPRTHPAAVLSERTVAVAPPDGQPVPAAGQAGPRGAPPGPHPVNYQQHVHLLVLKFQCEPTWFII